MLRNFAELGMALARAAARQALAAGEPTGADDPPPAGPVPDPVPAGAAASGGPQHDPGLAFARLAGAVRQSIALEARIAADAIGLASRPAPAAPADGPARRAIRDILHTSAAAEADPADRRAVREAIDRRVDAIEACEALDEASADPVVAPNCDDIGLDLDPATLPDSLLMAFARGGAGGTQPGRARIASGPDPP